MGIDADVCVDAVDPDGEDDGVEVVETNKMICFLSREELIVFSVEPYYDFGVEDVWGTAVLGDYHKADYQ